MGMNKIWFADFRFAFRTALKNPGFSFRSAVARIASLVGAASAHA